MTWPNRTVLCIDDNQDTCELVAIVLERAGYKVTICNTPDEGLQYAREGLFAAIILDFRFSTMTGPELCQSIREFDSRTPIIFYTAAAYAEERFEGMAAGAQAYLTKPDDFEILAETVAQLTGGSEAKAACG